MKKIDMVLVAVVAIMLAYVLVTYDIGKDMGMHTCTQECVLNGCIAE